MTRTHIFSATSPAEYPKFVVFDLAGNHLYSIDTDTQSDRLLCVEMGLICNKRDNIFLVDIVDRSFKKFVDDNFDVKGHHLQIMEYPVDDSEKRTGARGSVKTYFRMLA